MPAFIKPWTWKSKPPPGSQINYGHPLAQGLVGCFILNEQGPLQARNIVSGKPYGVNSNPSWDSRTQIGYALTSDANNEGINDALEARLQIPQRLTLMWRGSFNGTPDNNATICGALPNNSSSSPYLSYGFWVNAGNLAIGFNTPAFGNNSFRAITTWTDSKVHNFVFATNFDATASVNNQQVFTDGNYLEHNGAASGTVSYASDARFVIGEARSSSINSRTNTEVVYVWNKKLQLVDSEWLWADPFCMIQAPGPRIAYFKFTTGVSQALSATAQTASEIIISTSNSKPLAAVSESQGAIEAGMIASYALSSILDSGSEVVTLLYHDYNLPSVIAESASGINPLLGKLHALVVTSESASEVKALVGLQIPLNVKSQSASEAEPSLVRVFTGGIADFDIALQMNPPIAALDTGNRPVAFLLTDNDNEATLNPNQPNSAPDDSNFFV